MTIKTLLLTAGLASTLLVAPATRAATEVIDQVVAIVNDDIIMAMQGRDTSGNRPSGILAQQ